MVDSNKAVVYSEVFEILNLLGKKYIELIPKDLYNFFEENKLNTYSPVYDINKPLTNQKINKNTAAILCILHYNYWCKDDKEKEKISNILEYNEKNNKEDENHIHRITNVDDNDNIETRRFDNKKELKRTVRTIINEEGE